LHFTPREQIILLAGLDSDPTRRRRIWSLPELKVHLTRLTEAGLVDGTSLSDPTGVDAARRIHHITLDDLLAEHLPARS
jgi:hypothetical protein